MLLAENDALKWKVFRLECQLEQDVRHWQERAEDAEAENAALRARVEELEAQLRARERDFRTQDTLLEKIAELMRRNEELEKENA